MDPLRAITSTLTLFQDISSAYQAIQKLRGLPHEFEEVNRNLPVATATLNLAHDQLKDIILDNQSEIAIKPLVFECREKAQKLKDVFQQVAEAARDSRDGSLLEFYRTTLLHLGNAHRVETLMRDILRGLQSLATHQTFMTATRGQVRGVQHVWNASRPEYLRRRVWQPGNWWYRATEE